MFLRLLRASVFGLVNAGLVVDTGYRNLQKGIDFIA